MAGSVNKVILIGNLGADPEVKTFQNGGRIANLRIATSESWTDKMTNERKEKTEWHSVVLNSDGLVKVAENYLRKGSKVYVEGQLTTRKWQDRDGNDRYTTEITVGMRGSLTMLDGRQDGARDGGMRRDDNAESYARPSPSVASGGGAGRAFDDDIDDDVPF